MPKTKIKQIKIIDFNSIEAHIRWIHANRLKKHNLREFPAKALILNFEHSRFLKPYHIAPLACIIHEYQAAGFAIKISKIKPLIRSYLESFGFLFFCESLDNNAYDKVLDCKTFPLWHIKQELVEVYPNRVQKYYEDNLFMGQDLFVLGNSLAELMNNIFDHSNSKIPGYSFTQYNTRFNSITTCVCDFGIGIPSSINNFIKSSAESKLSDIDALLKAFIIGFSARSKPHNRGFGWNTIFGNIKSLKAKLHILSNKALFILHENGNTTKSLLSSSFPGTLVVITLNSNSLPKKEESDEVLDIY